MTRPHPTAAELLAHAGRSLPLAETLEVSAHLVACASCREAFAGLIPTSDEMEEAVRPGPPPGVDYETLTAYLDGTTDPVDREILEADLRNHPGLAAQLADLRRLRVEDESAPPSRPTIIPFPVPIYGASLFRVLTAAAALLIAAGLTWHFAAERSAPTLYDDGRQGSLRALTSAADIPPDLQTATRTAALTGEIRVPEDWKTLRGETGTLLAETSAASPDGPPFSLLTPVGTMIRGLQPVFRWTSCPGASAYRVTVLETPDGEAQSSPLLSATVAAWTPARPLAPGQRYAWQVQALDPEGNIVGKAPSPPRADAHFQTVTAAQETELRQLELGHPQACLLLAVAEARSGLLPEAEQHLQKLAVANPGKALPETLLRRVRALQGKDQPPVTTAPMATNGAQ